VSFKSNGDVGILTCGEGWITDENRDDADGEEI
jgi:hypothetical protein